MPRLAKSRQDILRHKQERESGYRLNTEAKAKKRERDRVHRERKKEQARLKCHEDPLAQLADAATQREYLEEENDVIVEGMSNEGVGEGEDSIDVSGVVEEDGEVLENLAAGAWEEGFNDEWGGGFDNGFEWDTNENGMEGLDITNGRGQCQGRGTDEH
jgi:hypothetical protein